MKPCSSFWQIITKPIIGLAPMDGVTDAAFRNIVDKYGRPSVLYTEFVSVEAIAHGADRVLRTLYKHDSSTPIIAQFIGSTPQDFYQAVFLAGILGFSGVDINMGCCDSTVMKKGAGAALINNPEQAVTIIKSVQTASRDWFSGMSIDKVGFHTNILEYVKPRLKNVQRKCLPVSIKTRIGTKSSEIKRWMNDLLSTKPEAIAIHGRTVEQRFKGEVDWMAIKEAANMAKTTSTLILGSGNVSNLKEALSIVEKQNINGVLIGRSAFGNPWIFTEKIPAVSERLMIMIEHCKKYQEYFPDGQFNSLRKHFTWYVKGLPGANHLKDQLMQVNNIDELNKTIDEYKRVNSALING